MSKHYTVSIPVKPYVKKYVETLEGSPLFFTSSSMLCVIIRAYMENKNYTGLSQKQMESAIYLRTAQIRVQVPMNKQYAIGLELRPDGILMINQFLECWFEKALQQFMKENTKKEGRYKGIKEALEGFAALYNIELDEDITFDGLKQMDYRLRNKEYKRKKGGNFFSKIVPSF